MDDKVDAKVIRYNEEFLRSLNQPSEPPECVKQNNNVYINAPLPKPNRPVVRKRASEGANKSYVSEAERQELARVQIANKKTLNTPKKSPRPLKANTSPEKPKESALTEITETEQNKHKEDTRTSLLLQDAQEQATQLLIKDDQGSTKANRPQARSKLSRAKEPTQNDEKTKGWKYSEERESDNHRLSQRQKQIEYGKNTNGYKNYLLLKPKENRIKGDPQTPLVEQKCSKRSWDGQLRKWRRLLHQYDPEGTDGDLSPEESDTKINELITKSPIPQTQSQPSTPLVSKEEREELAKMRLSMSCTKTTTATD